MISRRKKNLYNDTTEKKLENKRVMNMIRRILKKERINQKTREKRPKDMANIIVKIIEDEATKNY